MGILLSGRPAVAARTLPGLRRLADEVPIIRIVGIALSLCGLLVGALGTLAVIALHGACDKNCERIIPVWPFPVALLIFGALGIAVWVAGRAA